MTLAESVAVLIEQHLNEATSHLRNAARLVNQLEIVHLSHMERVEGSARQAANELVVVQNAIDNFRGR